MKPSLTLGKTIVQRPGAAAIAGTLVLLQAVLNVLEVLVLEEFVNGFSQSDWTGSLLLAAGLAGIYGFYYLQAPGLAWLNDRIRLRLRGILAPFIAEKTAKIPVAELEKADTQALLNRLQDAPEARYTKGFFALLQIAGGAVGMIGIFALIWNSVPWFLLAIVVLLGLMAGAFRLIGRYQVNLYRSRQEISRREDYLSGILFDRQLAQEKKLFGYTDYIQQLYKEETIHSGRKMLKSIFFVNAVRWVYDNITYLFSASAYILFLIPLYRGEIGLGIYVAIIPALTRLGTFFVEVGGSLLPSYQEYRACREDMAALEALLEQYYRASAVSGPLPEFHELRGEGIVFRYPGQEKPVLNGLNFSFTAGRNYALVGENGCGKSTLMKLLLGIYTPEKGRITIDGKDLQELDFGSRQRYFSVIFQDFNRYDYTLRENLTLSDLEAPADPAALQEALQKAQAEDWASRLPKGYDTLLGNLEEGGLELSGGQWQRLSIARMLCRKARICLWDEPTAAMDPVAESQLYTSFLQKRSSENANIFVTHRLGAAVSADCICVLDQGRFAEEGSHAQLMEKPDGLYRRMFEAQRGMYQ